MSGESFRLLIRALDAGPTTYLSFRWADAPGEPWVRRLDPPFVAEITRLLDTALIGDSVGDDRQEVKRALRGPFSSLAGERELTARLAALLDWEWMTDEVNERSARGEVTIEYTPSPALARLPIDLLPIDGDTRLMEKAELVCVPPAALHAGRAREPDNWDEVSSRPVLYVIDPDAPDAAGLQQILPPAHDGVPSNTAEFKSLLQSTHCTDHSGIGKHIDRWILHDELKTFPSRMVYFGHVSSTLNQPGSASLHLADNEYIWGLAAKHQGSHRPLSALDLLYGTVSYTPADAAFLDRRVVPGKEGHELWPMPPRVALIACEGGSDYRSTEIFGLVTACLNAGAELVTTTRWSLPSDQALATYAGVDDIPGPTTALALAVDAVHRTADPVAALNQWQREQLTAWRHTGDHSCRHTPLVWASLADHLCRWRPVDRRRDAVR